MDISNFVKLRPWLYHLTDERNLNLILSAKVMYSTVNLVKNSSIPNKAQILRNRRVGHLEINDGVFRAILRDQDPLSRKIIEKNLESNWSFEDFVYYLNSRVFFWSTERDLAIHYGRYKKQNEYPKIIRLATVEVFEHNEQLPQFCRLNSGAPRCSSFYKEGAPPRGPHTFLEADLYSGNCSSVREVTFLEQCKLPETVWVSENLGQPFNKVNNNGYAL